MAILKISHSSAKVQVAHAFIYICYHLYRKVSIKLELLSKKEDQNFEKALPIFCRGLFNKAIAQSGTALSPWAISEDPVKKARKIGAERTLYTNCTQFV